MKNDMLDKLAIPEARAKATASFTVQPLTYPENDMRKWCMFTLGVAVGAIGMIMIKAILEEISSDSESTAAG